MDINNIDDLPIIKHILAKMATNTDMIFGLHRDFNTLAAYETGYMNQLKRHEQQIKDLEQRLRALERNNTQTQKATYTPKKFSHKFQIDLLNRFLKISYATVLGFRSTELSDQATDWFKVKDDLNKLLGVDINFNWDSVTIELSCYCHSHKSEDGSIGVSHSDKLRVINDFLDITYPELFVAKEDNGNWDIFLDSMNDLLVSGDVGIKVSNDRFVLYCSCSECNKVYHLPCGYCDDRFDSLRSLRIHMCDFHDGDTELVEHSSENETTNVDTAIYSCTGCFDTFDTVSELKEHEPDCIRLEQDKMRFVFGDTIRGLKSDKPIVLINDDPDTIDLRQYNHELHDAYHDKLFEIEKLSNDDILLDHYKKYMKLACEFCSDDPVGIKNSSDKSKSAGTIELLLSDIKCGICGGTVTDFGNISIINHELFEYDCVIEARNIAGGKIPGKMHPTDDMHKVHLLVNGVVEGGYCGIKVTTPNSYFTSNLDHGLASFQEWCVDCLLWYVHEQLHYYMSLSDLTTYECDLCKHNITTRTKGG